MVYYFLCIFWLPFVGSGGRLIVIFNPFFEFLASMVPPYMYAYCVRINKI